MRARRGDYNCVAFAKLMLIDISKYKEVQEDNCLNQTIYRNKRFGVFHAFHESLQTCWRDANSSMDIHRQNFMKAV